jgi:hypothetical protein
MFADHPQPAVGAACVLLRHDLPDGSWHVDWLLDKRGSAPIASDPESRDLIAFRLGSRVDDLTAGAALPAERLADHRRLYLDYEGEISGNRGRVVRLIRGCVLAVSAAESSRSLLWDVRWESTGRAIRQRLRLEPVFAAGQQSGWVVHCDWRQDSAQ